LRNNIIIFSVIVIVYRMSKYSLKIVNSLIDLAIALMILIIFYSYVFYRIEALSYRLVIIFLTVIIISNLGAKLMVNYFSRDKL